MKTTITYARKHFTEMRRNYLSTILGLFLIATCFPLAFREMFGITSEMGREVLMLLGWASILIFTSTAFREWYTEGYDSFCLTLPVSINRRFLFQTISSLVISVLSTQIYFWLTYYGWEIFANYNCLVIEDAPMLMKRVVMTQVIIHSICTLCYARGGRTRTTSWLVIVGGFGLFFLLANLPEAAGWVSDNGARFPNLVNETDIIGNNWRFTLTNAPLGKATEVVKVLSGASVVVAFYLSAWMSLKEREARK